MDDTPQTISAHVAIEDDLLQLAETLRKYELANKVNPLLELGSYKKYIDGSKRVWRVWRDDRWTTEQLNNLEFWLVNLEAMPSINGGYETAKALFETEKAAIPFSPDTDIYRAKRADGQTYMRVYPDSLPKSWQVYSEELP